MVQHTWAKVWSGDKVESCSAGSSRYLIVESRPRQWLRTPQTKFREWATAKREL